MKGNITVRLKSIGSLFSRKPNTKLSLRKRASLVLASSSLILVGGYVALASPFASADNTLTLSGTVSNASGGVSGVAVTVTPPGSSSVSYGPSTTDSQGSYSLQVTSGQFDVHFAPPSGSGLAPVVQQNVDISADKTLNVQLVPAVHQFTGTLKDQAGNPFAGVTVSISQSPFGQAVTSATTDANGHFSMSASAAAYFLNVQSYNLQNLPEHLSSMSLGQEFNRDINLTDGDLNLDLVIKAVTLHVTVLDAGGNPISGAAVQPYASTVSTSFYANDSGEYSSGALFSNGVTASDGTVSLGSIVGATYNDQSYNSICATVSGVKFCYRTQFTVTGDTNITIQQPPTRHFTGVLRDSSGNPVPNVHVGLAPSTGAELTASSVTNSSGAFDVSVAPGAYNVRLDDPIPADHIERFEISQNGSGPIDLTNGNVNQDLDLQTVKLNVTVQDSGGNPITGVPVSAVTGAGNTSLYTGDPGEMFTGIYSSSATTDASGHAQLGAISGSEFGLYDNYSICATISSVKYCVTPSSFTINGDTNLTITKTVTNHFTGVLKDTSGTALAGVVVNLTSAANGQAVATATTQSDGSFDVQTNPGKYFLELRAGTTAVDKLSSFDFAQQTKDIDLTAGDLSRDLTLPTATLHVTVKDQFGSPIQNSAVSGKASQGNIQLYAGDPGEALVGAFNSTANTDSNGKADIGTVVGIKYSDDQTYNNICATISNAPVCLSGQRTITGDADFLIQQVSSLPILNQAVNAGGGTSGSYAADTGFSGGSTYSSTASVDTSNVASPAPQAVYQTVRYGNSFSYTFSGLTPGATYTLVPHFNELYWGTSSAGGGYGSRVFNVSVNGQSALSNYDIFKVACGANRAVTEQVVTTADTDGKVVVQFSTVTDNAMVNGLELYNGELPAQAPHPACSSGNLINAGGSATGDFVGDANFSGGTTYSSNADVDTSGVTNPAPQDVFKTVRYGNFSYTIPGLTPNTSYNVRLDFNELYWGALANGGVGSRVFNVSINGTSELSNFDIYSEAGGANKALAKDFTVTSDADGKITIQFTTITDNAVVSGIEVTQP